MDVLIIETNTGKLIGSFPIVLGGQNYTPSEKEYFDQAWRCALEDNMVEQDGREKYSFKLGD